MKSKILWNNVIHNQRMNYEIKCIHNYLKPGKKQLIYFCQSINTIMHTDNKS